MFLNNNVRVQAMGSEIYTKYIDTQLFMNLIFQNYCVLNDLGDHGNAHFLSPSALSPSALSPSAPISGTMFPTPPVQSIGSYSPSLQVA